MAAAVGRCLQTATFGKKVLRCQRGIKQEQYLFDDEQSLHAFLSLSEQDKQEYTDSYQVKDRDLLNELHFTWGVDPTFDGSYHNDYAIITNGLEKTTAWKDKYTTTLFSPTAGLCCTKQIQPLPDYLRWLRACELHYMTTDEVKLLEPGPWDEIPGIFLPSKILDLCFTVMPNPPPNIEQLIAILAWTRLDETREYYAKLHAQVQSTLESDTQREKWKDHPLYKENSKDDLVKMCHTLKIPVQACLSKVRLVMLIAEKKEEQQPSRPMGYTGRLVGVPMTSSGIGNLSVGSLRRILHFHRLPVLGSKEELVLRVFLLRQGKTAAVTAREEEKLKDLIGIIKLLIWAQRKIEITTHTYQRRTHSTKTYHHFIPPPANTIISNLHNLFDPLDDYLQHERLQRDEADRTSVVSKGIENGSITSKEHIKEIGSKVKVKWSMDEIGDSGWYVARVQSYDEVSDILTVAYTSEPGCTYDLNLTSFVETNKIKLIQAVL